MRCKKGWLIGKIGNFPINDLGYGIVSILDLRLRIWDCLDCGFGIVSIWDMGLRIWDCFDFGFEISDLKIGCILF
jgi:hypothetical protein